MNIRLTIFCSFFITLFSILSIISFLPSKGIVIISYPNNDLTNQYTFNELKAEITNYNLNESNSDGNDLTFQLVRKKEQGYLDFEIKMINKKPSRVKKVLNELMGIALDQYNGYVDSYPKEQDSLEKMEVNIFNRIESLSLNIESKPVNNKAGIDLINNQPTEYYNAYSIGQYIEILKYLQEKNIKNEKSYAFVKKISIPNSILDRDLIMGLILAPVVGLFCGFLLYIIISIGEKNEVIKWGK